MIALKRISLYISMAVGGLLLIAHCTGKTVSIGGTESGNARIVGTLYETDGKTPAVGVHVVIRPRKSLADTGSEGHSRTEDSVLTDNSGTFAFDSTVGEGIYVIEALSGNNAVLIDFVVVKEGDSTVTLAPRTLKPAGAIKGVVELSEGDDPRKVFVLLFGIDRLGQVEADGTFKIERLAEAEYDVRILPSFDYYMVLDTMDIPVISADTTDLGILSLPFTGIPTVNDITISYDTTMRIVTVTWSEADTSLISGYNVYRRNIDSNTIAVRINDSPIPVTRCLDSTMQQQFTYEYKVVAIDKLGNEGTFGEGERIKPTGVYDLVKTVETGFRSVGFTVGNGRIYLCDNIGKKIHIIDTSGEAIGCLGDTGLQALSDPTTITWNNDTLYVVDDNENTRIKCYRPDGDLIKVISCGNIRLWNLNVVSGNEMYAGGVDRQSEQFSIYRLDSAGTVVRSLLFEGDGSFFLHDSMLGVTKKYYSNDSEATIVEWFSRDFERVDTVIIKGIQTENLMIDENGYFYAFDSRGILVFDPQGSLSARFDAEGHGFIQFDSNGLLYIRLEDKIFIYDKPERSGTP